MIAMRRLNFLTILVNLVLVFKCFFVTPQREDPLVVECGENDVYPGHYSQATLVRSYNFILGQYRNYENCQVKFRTENTPILLTVRFIAFDLEVDSQCGFDFLCINGIRFCGNWERGKNYSFLVPANNSFTLWFKSDSSVTGRGFEVKVEVQRAYYLPNHREVVSGVGSSENLLVYGQSNLEVYEDRCLVSRNNATWPPPPGTSTAGYPDTSYSPPYTSSLHQTTSRAAPTTYGPLTQGSHTTTPTQSTRVFYCTSGPPWRLYLVTPNRSYILRSDEFGSRQYSNNMSCYYEFYTSRDPVVLTLTFNSFEVEHQESCSYDWLCVNGVRYCGTWETGTSFSFVVPAYKTFTVSFSSDYFYSEKEKGFEIKLDTQETDNTTVLSEPYSGYGSSYDALVFRLSNQQTYTDRCSVSQSGLPASDYDSTNDYQSTTGNYDTATASNPRSRAATVVQCYDSSNFVLNPSYSDNYFIIRSPNFGIGPYNNRSSCTVQFRTSYTPSVFTLRYNCFDIENDQTCAYDWLCVKGIKFCGSWLTGQEFQYAVPALSSFTVKFQTDGSVVARGFEVDVSIDEFRESQGFFEPSLGVGSSLENLNYTWTDLGKYVDKCSIYNIRA